MFLLANLESAFQFFYVGLLFWKEVTNPAIWQIQKGSHWQRRSPPTPPRNWQATNQGWQIPSHRARKKKKSVFGVVRGGVGKAAMTLILSFWRHFSMGQRAKTPETPVKFPLSFAGRALKHFNQKSERNCRIKGRCKSEGGEDGSFTKRQNEALNLKAIITIMAWTSVRDTFPSDGRTRTFWAAQ